MLRRWEAEGHDDAIIKNDLSPNGTFNHCQASRAKRTVVYMNLWELGRHLPCRFVEFVLLKYAGKSAGGWYVDERNEDGC